ncbi:MAG: PDZ domain-containing protein [Acidobacteriota bacterium]|jgi:S1-C subfamily serine protease|nr:PDZ domain-containing protein [Acidobacteriota bacterium]
MFPLSFIFRARVFCAAVFLLAVLAVTAAAFGQDAPAVAAPDPGLVRVSIISEFRGPKGNVNLNGKVLRDYSPLIIQDFSSAGVVFDDKGHVMTFLSYRWVDIQSENPRIEISSRNGQILPGKLIGIDQRNGVAVIRAMEGKPAKTAVCESCESKDGSIVLIPSARDSGAARFGETRVVLSGGGSALAPGALVAPYSQPFPDISLHVLNREFQVVGLMTSQDSTDAGVVYPVKQLLDSARQVVKAGGNIRVGWLGIMLLDEPSGVQVQGVEPNSPAQEAGISARDFLVRYDSRPVENARQFISLVQNSAVGSKVKIEISRMGKPMSLTAKIRERQAQASQNRLSLNSPRPVVGLDTTPLTPDLADVMQMPGQKGLLVIGVLPQTPASAAGVLEGDVITAMDGWPIFDIDSFASYWQSHSLGSRLVLTVLRKGKERSISVRLNP